MPASETKSTISINACSRTGSICLLVDIPFNMFKGWRKRFTHSSTENTFEKVSHNKQMNGKSLTMRLIRGSVISSTVRTFLTPSAFENCCDIDALFRMIALSAAISSVGTLCWMKSTWQWERQTPYFERIGSSEKGEEICLLNADRERLYKVINLPHCEGSDHQINIAMI